MSFKLVQRAVIRRYIQDMLIADVDIADRVFTSRPNSDLFLEELPAINIHYGEETATPNVGNDFFVSEYKKIVEVNITICVYDQIKINEQPVKTKRGQDYLDYLSWQVERSFRNDIRLARRLPDFDADTDYMGLIHSSKLLGILTYDIDTKNDIGCLGSMLRYELVYDEPGYMDNIYPDFEEAYITTEVQ
jgi:hypothetical protein